MNRRGRGRDHVYCASLFSMDGPAGSLRRPDSGPTCLLPESRALAFRARRLARAAVFDPHPGCRRNSHPGEIHLNSIAVGFGIATLVATGFLFVLQVVED